LCGSTVALFFIEDFGLQIVIFLAVGIIYIIPGKSFLFEGFRQLKILWPFILIVAIWHVWIGELSAGGVIGIRLLSAVAIANLVTMTTRLTDMIDVIAVIVSPLKVLGLRPRVLEVAIALVIRLTPVLVSKGSQLSDSWRSRSKRAPSWSIIFPFTVLALDDADHVADALRARGGFEPLKENSWKKI
jgi:biotin transport system permease protein